ncbi:MAG TPA: hypothetical protein ENK44_02500, partial [Caldithrix abyssi]|nr:hypothetical protein [Caldithrix abyssi]
MMDDYKRRANFVLKERLPLHRKISDATERQSIVKVLKDVFDLLHDSFGLHPLPETLADPNVLCKFYKENLYVSRDINRDKAENILMVMGLRGKKGHRQLLIHTYPEGGFKKTDVDINIDDNLLMNFKSKIFPYLRSILGYPEQHKNKEKILGSITKIYLENFKSIKDRQVIELKPITLLFGPNSAGKSTVIQALHYMREILLRQNFNADRTMYGGDVIDLGGFRNLVYNHDISLPIVMRFDLNLEKLDFPSYNPYTDFDFYFEETLENEEGLLESAQRGERDIIDNIYDKAKSAYVQITVKWNEEHNKAIVTDYETGFNDIKMAS